MLNPVLLRQIFPTLHPQLCEQYTPLLNKALLSRQINTIPRIAMFLGQIGHESASFKYWEEIWIPSRPTRSQQRYEPPNRQAVAMGNTRKGDGYRFRGRGPIQLTWARNYKLYGKWLNLPLYEKPDLAAQPEYGFLIAATYWVARGLNGLADEGEFRLITRRINGGYTHYERRVALWREADRVLRRIRNDHKVILNSRDVTGKRVTDSPKDSFVVNSTVRGEVKIYRPVRGIIHPSREDPLDVNVYLNGTCITGQRLVLDGLIVNSTDNSKLYLTIK